MLSGEKVVVVLPAHNAEKTLRQPVAEIPTDIVDEVTLTVTRVKTTHLGSPANWAPGDPARTRSRIRRQSTNLAIPPRLLGVPTSS